MDIIEKINQISEEYGWFARHADFIEVCHDEGLEVPDINSEYAVVTDEDDNECIVYFGGTERTIIIEKVKEAW